MRNLPGDGHCDSVADGSPKLQMKSGCDGEEGENAGAKWCEGKSSWAVDRTNGNLARFYLLKEFMPPS